MKRLEDENKRQAEKRSDLKSDLEKHKNRAYTLETEVKSHNQNIAGLGKQKEAVKKRINENATKLRNLVGEVSLQTRFPNKENSTNTPFVPLL
jgi:chromosome segregation ATPase